LSQTPKFLEINQCPQRNQKKESNGKGENERDSLHQRHTVTLRVNIKYSQSDIGGVPVVIKSLFTPLEIVP